MAGWEKFHLRVEALGVSFTSRSKWPTPLLFYAVSLCCYDFAAHGSYCSCLLFMLFSWSIRFSKCETARLLPTLFQQFEFLTPTSGKSGRWHARLHFKMSIYFQNTTVCKIEKSILSFTGIHKYANPAVVACTSHPTFLMSRKASHRETRMAWTSFLKASGPQFWQ